MNFTKLRWTVARKLAALSALALVVGLVVGVVGTRGTNSMSSGLRGVEAANSGQAAMAEVDASHDNVQSDVLMAQRYAGTPQHDPAIAALHDDQATLVAKVAEVKAANVSPALSREAGDLEAPIAALVAAANTAATGNTTLDAFQQAFNDVTPRIDSLSKHLQDQAAQIARTSQATADTTKREIVVAILIATAIVVLLGWRISRSITVPLRKTVGLLGDVAKRKLSTELDVTSDDEIGEMATSLNTALRAMRDALGTIDATVQTLAGASDELSAVSNQMAGSAEETSTQSGVVSAASEQVSAIVNTVAAAVEEFSASINEISKSASDAAGVALEAASMAQTVNDNIGRLDHSSTEIGNVVGVITSIAEQTNLLALNATIEAARAGDAGKGFAVVANEVKELASSTTRATEDISQRITTIQADTRQAIGSVGEIMTIIDRINALQSAIAAAVEEQSVTTNEIGRSISEAASGTAEIARSITGVATAAQEAAQGASQTLASAGDLASMSLSLRELVGQFEI